MSRQRNRTKPRDRRMSALEMLEAHLKTNDEASWYAERLERLGLAMFGDLWRSEDSKAVAERQKLP